MHYTDNRSRISCLNLVLLHEWCVLNRLSNANLKKEPLFVNKQRVLLLWRVPTCEGVFLLLFSKRIHGVESDPFF
jgi:hypothetical protein